jgi:WD40 repeat protein
MSTDYQPLFASSFLRGHWQNEFERYRQERDEELLACLTNWANKRFQKETSAEGTFVDVFFKQLWGFVAAGDGKTLAAGCASETFKLWDVASGKNIASFGGGAGWSVAFSPNGRMLVTSGYRDGTVKLWNVAGK